MIERSKISDSLMVKYNFDIMHLNRAFDHYNLRGNPELG